MQFKSRKLVKIALGALVLISVSAGMVQATAPVKQGPLAPGCPYYPGCEFGGTSFYCCDPA